MGIHYPFLLSGLETTEKEFKRSESRNVCSGCLTETKGPGIVRGDYVVLGLRTVSLLPEVSY